MLLVGKINVQPANFGNMTNNILLRALASAAVIALTILKAFMSDMSTLTGFIARCRSFASGWCW